MKTLRNLGLAAVTLGAILACSTLSTTSPPTADVSTIVAATFRALAQPTAAPAATQPAATQAAPTQAATAQPPAGISVSCGAASFVIPQGLASSAASESVAAVTDQTGAPWEVAPAYTRCTLQGYPLQGKFFEPQIMIYPAPDYTALNTGGTMSIQRLQAVLASPSAPLSNDTLPRLPFANAEQIVAGQMGIIAFKGGSGVRVLAEYAQYNAPINNHELFYHFEGLTSDGKYYIVTTLPINAAFLAAESDPASPVPADGIQFPGTNVTDSGVWKNYYQAVTAKLNANAPEAFQPSLAALDTLMQSLQLGQ